MSKVIGKSLADEPSSPPSEAVARSTRSLTIAMSVNPLFIIGSAMPRAGDSTEWTGMIAPAPHGKPLGPRPPSRIWS